ncbi:MAG: fibronectin type III domain-containing protein [Verrucomicrobia bacterium]|nr:fibronectin type III domain-containing protein [Verrucomicrobiota bacterium]
MKTRSLASRSIRPTAGGIRCIASLALRSLNLALLLVLLVAPLRHATAADVTLAWDPSPDATVVGYKLHWGGVSRTYTSHLDVGNVMTATVPSLQAGTTYYFAATAYDGAGLESDYSNEVEYTPPAPNQPPTLATLVNRTIDEDTSTGPIALTVGDVDNDVNSWSSPPPPTTPPSSRPAPSPSAAPAPTAPSPSPLPPTKTAPPPSPSPSPMAPSPPHAPSPHRHSCQRRPHLATLVNRTIDEDTSTGPIASPSATSITT